MSVELFGNIYPETRHLKRFTVNFDTYFPVNNDRQQKIPSISASLAAIADDLFNTIRPEFGQNGHWRSATNLSAI